jgi:hypothetical protein
MILAEGANKFLLWRGSKVKAALAAAALAQGYGSLALRADEVEEVCHLARAFRAFLHVKGERSLAYWAGLLLALQGR